jgi:imidazole glycerol phosphate synthase subunit HisF
MSFFNTFKTLAQLIATPRASAESFFNWQSLLNEVQNDRTRISALEVAAGGGVADVNIEDLKNVLTPGADKVVPIWDLANSRVRWISLLDEDDLVSDDDDAFATQQSIKAYIDSITRPNVDAKVTINSSQPLGTGLHEKLDLDSADYDIGSDFDLTNNFFVVPYDGRVSITGSVMYNAAAAGAVTITRVVKDLGGAGETLIAQIYRPKENNSFESVPLNVKTTLTAGDEISITVYCAVAGGIAHAGFGNTFVQFEYR